MTDSSCAHLLSLAGLLVAVSSAAAGDSSIRCDGGIVQIGDTRVDLLGKCGEPALRDVTLQETGVAVVGNGPIPVDAVTTTATVEQWTFNLGSNRLVQIVTLESGRVVRIEGGSYGYDPQRLRASRGGPPCDSSAIRVGDRKLDLLAKCGQPTALDVRREKRAASAAAGDAAAIQFTTVEIEVWTYDLGPHQFIVIATVEGGKVVAVKYGGYGYRR
ncbi:MAG: hypothetical protein A2V77_17790 [Anaeromyxobacter sp. RBG_16_69_14]|nr:MAG: hypothetical protein A2V77_17790 [Anaeromyxobacter sp. RBG_16_69_14]